MQFQKISILPTREVFLFCTPLSLGNSRLFSYVFFKNLAFNPPPPPPLPLPLGISHDLPWGWYGFFLEKKVIVKQMHCKKIVNFSIYCVFPESIYTPHMEGHWKFLGGGGG